MGLKKIKNVLINEDNYVYPYPELIFQTTREASSLVHLGSTKADNDNGYIYFYADSDWKNNPNVYVGESKNDIQSRHNATHKNSAWFKNITYPLIGIVNSPNLPWDTDTRRAIESKTVYKLHALGLEIVNGANSTWTNGGTVHPNVNDQYVEDVSGIIVDYIFHHLGFRRDNTDREYSSVTSLLQSRSKEEYLTKNTKLDKAKKYYPNISLAELIQNNILESNIEIISVSPTYPGKAIIRENGEIDFNGSTYTSLSTAGGECMKLVNPNISSPNGWSFWGIKQNDGSIVKLEAYRKNFTPRR